MHIFEKENYNKYYFYEKALQTIIFWVNLKEIFSPTILYGRPGDVLFGDFIFT